MKKTKKQKVVQGMVTPLILIISTVFIIVIYAILFVLAMQFDYSNRQVASEVALQIADAGINYYRWHLYESPNDFQDGTGVPGPYIHDYTDPQGGITGKFSLEITPPSPSSQIVTIESTAWTNQYPKVKKIIKAQYGRVALTQYAFLHNANLWFGNDITINGPLFSNGGIRQDGTNTSTVQSSKATYICGAESGCSSSGETKPGIWGNGKIQSLWQFPVIPIDFDSIKVDFNQMKSAAQSSGLYLAPSGAQGYHLVFIDDGTVNVFQVTGNNYVKGYSLENGCEDLYQTIISETLIGNYLLSSNQIIFAEDNLWVEGVVKGKTTVVSARFPIGTYDTFIWIPDNLTYYDKSGDYSIGLVAEKNIIMTRDVPDDLEIDGALLAQNGQIIRHHYGYFGCKSPGTDKIKHELIIYGSIISNQRSYWNFSSGPKSPASGFQKSTLNYDPNIYYSPPPYFPASGQYNFISWSEER